jgi:hypothetical protein
MKLLHVLLIRNLLKPSKLQVTSNSTVPESPWLSDYRWVIN